jgi:hypothetical protein
MYSWELITGVVEAWPLIAAFCPGSREKFRDDDGCRSPSMFFF